MLYALRQDFIYAGRLLRRNPGFTLAVTLILALAIGANTAIFSVVDTVLLRPLPYRDSGQLFALGELSQYADFGPTTPGNFLDYQNRLHSLETAATVSRSFTLTGHGLPSQFRGQVVSSDFFNLLGIHPQLGRVLSPQLDRPYGTRTAVLSDGVWRRVFSGDPGVIGSAVTLDGESFIVAGVMPKTFVSPQAAELWVSPRYEAPEPLSDSKPDEMEDRGNFNFLRSYARLRPGYSRAQAQAELRVLSKQLEQQYPGANAKKRALIVPLIDWMVGDVRTSLLTLQFAVGLILLIACANIANLMLTRGTLRYREMAVRSSLGAERLRLLRQLLAESCLLAFLGGAFGLLLAILGVHLLATMKPGDLPRLNELRADPMMLLFAAGASLATASISGLLPAWRTSRTDTAEILKQGGRSVTASGKRLRSALVVLEITLSVALLVALTLLVRSFMNTLRVDPGFKPEQVLVAEISLPTSRYDTDEKARDFLSQLLQRAQALPGVIRAGIVDALPLSNNGLEGKLLVADQPAAKDQLKTEKRVVSPGYFNTLSIHLLQGRDFSSMDDRRGAPVVIINEHLARVVWSGQNPLGKRLSWGRDWMTVIGVVGNVHQYSLEETLTLDTYIPYQQAEAVRSVALTIRSQGEPLLLGTSVRALVSEIDKNQAITRIALLHDLLAQSYARRRFQTVLIAILGLFALILACVGVYAAMAYTVSQRTHEFGIRLALGAERSRLFRSVLGETGAIAALGVIAGLLVAAGLARLIASLLYQVTKTDVVSYGLPSIVVLAAAILAGYVPARRAMNVDPLVAMRDG